MLRTKIANWFGRKEHSFGEYLGVYLLIITIYFKDYYIAVALVLWTVYYISHRFEKKFYGKFGPRG